LESSYDRSSRGIHDPSGEATGGSPRGPHDPELHLTVKRAAEIQGRTVTDFVIQTLQIAATQAIEEASLVRLSLSDQQLFAQALISPPEPNAALKRAVDRYNKLLG